MTKRERLEDLGIILKMLEDITNDDDFQSPWNDAQSKHSYDTFVAKYSNRDKLEDLHDWIRSIKHKLDEVWCVARGDDE